MRLRLAGTCIAAAAAACLSRPSPIGGDAGRSGGDGQPVGPDAPSVTTNYVFVSAEVFVKPWASGSPESGSADGSCTRWASDAGRAGDYIAWLSYGDGPGNDAANRLRQLNADGNWKLTNGATFAATVDEIVQGQIQAAPKFDEYGHDVTTAGSVQVATGTAPDGTYDGGASADCPAGSIEVGDPSKTTDAWTATDEVTCTVTNLRLYCFGYSGQ